MATRISFSTPEGDVKGVEPVKFMAKKELTHRRKQHQRQGRPQGNQWMGMHGGNEQQARHPAR